MDNVIKMPTKLIEMNEGPITVKEDQKLEHDDFITRRELESIEEKIDLKIRNSIQPLEGKIELLTNNLDSKFELFESKMVNMFNEQEEILRKQRNTNIQWTIGTVIAAVGVLSTIIISLLN